MIISPKTVLMCPPKFFGVHYKINPWMARSRGEENTDPVDRRIALSQWNCLVKILVKEGIKILTLNPIKDLPDMVFTANAGFIHEDNILLSNFRPKERRPENNEVWKFFVKKGGLKVLWLPITKPQNKKSKPNYFEGHGDGLLYWGTNVFGYGMRSNQQGIKEAISRLCITQDTLNVKLINQNFYHLDTCFCPIGKTLLWYPPAFSEESVGKIEELVFKKQGKSIVVSREDAECFACNGIPVQTTGGWKLITNPISQSLKKQLHGFVKEIIEVEISEFLKAGGGNRCLVLFL